MSTFVFLNNTLSFQTVHYRYFTASIKQRVLNNVVNNKRYLYGCNIYHKPISCLRVYGLLYITISTYSYTSLKYLDFQNQYMYIQLSYRNPTFCTYVLHKQHGQFFWVHSQIFFLNSIGDTILFNSVCKTSHIFGAKLDIVSEPYITVLILLPCSVMLFLRL